MDTSESKDPTGALQNRMSSRIALLVAGAVIVLGVFGLAAVLFKAPVAGTVVSAIPQPVPPGAEVGGGSAISQDSRGQVSAVPQPDRPGVEVGGGSAISQDSRGQVSAVPQPDRPSVGALSAPVVIENSQPLPKAMVILPLAGVVILGLLAYAVYDLLKLYLQYRISKERDEVMFP